MSHFIEYDAPSLGRDRVRALCGEHVHTSEYSAVPTCKDCQVYLREDAENIEGVQAQMAEVLKVETYQEKSQRLRAQLQTFRRK